MVNVFVWPLPVTVRTTGSAASACGGAATAPASTTAATASSATSTVATTVLRIFMLQLPRMRRPAAARRGEWARNPRRAAVPESARLRT